MIFSPATIWLHLLGPTQSWYEEGRGNAMVMNPKGVIKKVTVFACGAVTGFLFQLSPYWKMELPQTIGNLLVKCTRWRWPSYVCSQAWMSYEAHHWRLGFATTNGFLSLGRMCWQHMESFTPLKLKIFRFLLISGVLSCKSYIRFKTAVKYLHINAVEHLQYIPFLTVNCWLFLLSLSQQQKIEYCNSSPG